MQVPKRQDAPIHAMLHSFLRMLGGRAQVLGATPASSSAELRSLLQQGSGHANGSAAGLHDSIDEEDDEPSGDGFQTISLEVRAPAQLHALAWHSACENEHRRPQQEHRHHARR